MNLYQLNSPKHFWHFVDEIPDAIWQRAIKQAKPLLGIACDTDDINSILRLVLGEGQFGAHHWKLSLAKRLYYLLKPLLPRSLTKLIRKYYSNPLDRNLKISWPIEARYALYQWEVLRQALMATGIESASYKSLWPKGYRFAFTLTHDVETADGQAFVHQVADLEESLGFRSSFNFVLERYTLDLGLIQELKERGFEVGCHGLKHDGKLFNTKTGFMKRAAKINAYMKEYEMVGFRSPLTHRNPEWMQELDIEYDLSFFDTDPFEPIPGGTMNIWPFFIGRFVELPYTLVQDYTLTAILSEISPRIWLDKVAFIEKNYGLALLNSHPDYLKEKNTWNVYTDFLKTMRSRNNYWHALPREVANWWRLRAQKAPNPSNNLVHLDTAQLKDGYVVMGSAM